VQLHTLHTRPEGFNGMKKYPGGGGGVVLLVEMKGTSMPKVHGQTNQVWRERGGGEWQSLGEKFGRWSALEERWIMGQERGKGKGRLPTGGVE